MAQIKLQYQVKKTRYSVGNNVEHTWEVRELVYECDPNKSERDNIDAAYLKASKLGADPLKNIRWRWID